MQKEQQTLVELNNDIKVLEGDGKLSELNHLYGMQKSVVQSLSKEYMSLTYIKILIETHIKAIRTNVCQLLLKRLETFEFVTKVDISMSFIMKASLLNIKMDKYSIHLSCHSRQRDVIH